MSRSAYFNKALRLGHFRSRLIVALAEADAMLSRSEITAQEHADLRRAYIRQMARIGKSIDLIRTRLGCVAIAQAEGRA